MKLFWIMISFCESGPELSKILKVNNQNLNAAITNLSFIFDSSKKNEFYLFCLPVSLKTSQLLLLPSVTTTPPPSPLAITYKYRGNL